MQLVSHAAGRPASLPTRLGGAIINRARFDSRGRHHLTAGSVTQRSTRRRGNSGRTTAPLPLFPALTAGVGRPEAAYRGSLLSVRRRAGWRQRRDGGARDGGRVVHPRSHAVAGSIPAAATGR